MNSPEVKEFIKEHSSLFWYTPENEKENISQELLVETILNYGDMDAVRKLFKVLGLKVVAEIFYRSINQSERKKGNYHDLVLNYFTCFFRKHAS